MSRILVAEDDQFVRDMVVRALKRDGFEVVACEDGNTALARLRRDSSFDLLVSDLRMPGADGLEVLTQAKAHWPGLPVLLMTAYGEAGVLKDALRRGCDGYIDKPFRVEELVADVHRLLGSQARLRTALAGPGGKTSTRSVSRPISGPSLGDYELLGEIARGGMGIVYKAKQVSLDRIVALKTIRPSRAAASTKAGERFLREARSMARLRHSHIAVVHEVGEEEGVQFFSMEYVEGSSLLEVLKRRRLAIPEALELLTPIADGLAHAHDLGILHHDIKPANIMIHWTGRPVLVDFGIATQQGDPDEERDYVEGTLQYMAPEYAYGERFNEFADMFSFAALLYEAVAGLGVLPYWDQTKGPERVRDPNDLVARVQPNFFTPLSKRVKGVTPQLDKILRRALCPDSSQRFGSMYELVGALSDLG